MTQMILFDPGESLPPMHQWMREHGIATVHSPDEEVYPWAAYSQRLFASMGDAEAANFAFYGNTEEDACDAIAGALRLTTWDHR